MFSFWVCRLVFCLYFFIGVLGRASTFQSVCDKCPTGTCCEHPEHDFPCCPYINGVCCAGAKFCCPQGSTCSLEDLKCNYANGRVYVPKTTVQVNIDIDNDKVNAVCCEDGLHCCPEGTKCNSTNGTCDPFVDPILSAILSSKSILPVLGQSRKRVSQPYVNEPDSLDLMAFNGSLCNDSIHECPSKATCCLDETGQYACCPMSDAVCCSDGIHCCPQYWKCNLKTEKCEMSDSELPVQSITSPAGSVKDTLCPDGKSTCTDGHGCCQLSDESYGCCPVEHGICCKDGLHCCPNGYQCDIANRTCVKAEEDLAVEKRITCPNDQFQCNEKSTCCPLPNEEWACCPLSNATCCGDMAHCCPQNSTCDMQHNRCILHDGQTIPAYASSSNTHQLSSSDLCASGLVSCPNGTCCKSTTVSGMCCPLPDAVCCADGQHCCPKGHRCEASTSQCVPTTTSTSDNQEKVEKSAIGENARNRTCSDGSTCLGNRTCCPTFFSKYGCCPFDNGTCCADRQHCCPFGHWCTAFGLCRKKRFDDLSMSFASYLVPTIQNTVGFLEHIQPGSFRFSFANDTRRATIDPLFLFDGYLLVNKHKVTVCPDRERRCQLNEQCCLSSKHGYTCAPKESQCCMPQSDKCCAVGTKCSNDGLRCDPY